MKTKLFLRGLMLAAALLTCASGFHSCSQDKDGDFPGGGIRVAVQFNAQASTTPSAPQGRSRAADGFETRAFALPTVQTRTTTDAVGETMWSEGDGVGIFMLTASGTLPGQIVEDANNRQYIATPTTGTKATLAPAAADQIINYPASGNVDFIAYYPWRATPDATPYLYAVNVSAQSTAGGRALADVLYSNNVTNKAASAADAATLEFNHALSRLVINVTGGTGMSAVDISAVSVVMKGFPTTADLSLANGTTFTNAAVAGTGIVPLKWGAPATDYAATFDAIVIPQVSGTGRSVVFTVESESYIWALDDSEDFDFGQGNTNTYHITIGKTGITVNSSTITKWEGTTEAPVQGTAATIDAVKIKAGTFLMGSPDTEPNRYLNETQHSVTLTKDFYMSKYEITNAQYAAFLTAKAADGLLGFSTGGSYPNAAYLVATEPLVYDCTTPRSPWGVKRNADGTWEPVSGYENHPVIYVTWFGAKAFADWVGGALPTEAQWEYACRGGQSTSLPFGIGDGTKLTHEMANFLTFRPYDLTNIPAGGFDVFAGTGNVAKPTVVGSYPYFNGYGLYDMHGNVWEWCYDSWDSLAAYGPGAVTDPVSPNAGSFRVLRGGSWDDFAQDCRSASRGRISPGYADNIIGFRVVFVP